MLILTFREDADLIYFTTFFEGDPDVYVIQPRIAVVSIPIERQLTEEQAQDIVDRFCQLTSGILLSWHIDSDHLIG
jgi:hypothetical protein